METPPSNLVDAVPYQILDREPYGPLVVPQPAIEQPARHYSQKLLDWANAEIRNGISRRRICQALRRYSMVSEETFLSMRQKDRDALLDAQEARLSVADELNKTMVERDMRGRCLEKEGRLQDAILVYEANIADATPDAHAYERLITIYTERSEFRSAARICRFYLDNRPKSADNGWLYTLLEQLEGYERRSARALRRWQPP